MLRAQRNWMPAWFAVAVAICGICGCGGARYVAVQQDSGVVAIPSNTNSWPLYYRDKAETLMREKCPNGYVIEHEEEVAVGTHTTAHKQADTSSIGAVLLQRQNTVTDSTPVKEWQITYHAN